MAQVTFRTNLASAIFPFASELWGRSIIVPQYDQNFDRTTLNAPGVTIDKGIPQIFYMHNCMPTSQGYQAIGYNTILEAFAGVATDFDNAYQLQNSDGNRFLLVPSAGKNYIYDGSVGAWASISPVAQGIYRDDILVTTAFVQGQSYIYYSGVGCFTYDDTNKVLTPQTLISLDPTQVKGICSANGYMITWGDKTVAWSNLTNPLDFAPSLSTGAGSGNVNEAKGKILACLQVAGGFLVYCEQNIVSARYSGNTNFPFVFKEVPGSGGIEDIDKVSWHANLPFHIVWDGNGLQQVSLSNTTTVYPEATDFLASQIFEDFDEDTLTFSSEYLSAQLHTNVNIVSARFLVLSYGINYPDFTHALVFDLLLNRWGKLKITHRCCFQFNFPNPFGALTYGQLSQTYGSLGIHTTYGDLGTRVTVADEFKKSLAFLQADGTVQIVDFEFSEANSAGVFVCGKFQFQRNQTIEHQMADIDIVGETNTFNYYIVPSYDGKTLRTPVPGFLYLNADKMRTYKKMVSGLNISCMFIGQFHLASFVLTLTSGGSIL